jgi:hypothetical protein
MIFRTPFLSGAEIPRTNPWDEEKKDRLQNGLLLWNVWRVSFRQLGGGGGGFFPLVSLKASLFSIGHANFSIVNNKGRQSSSLFSVDLYVSHSSVSLHHKLNRYSVGSSQ